MQKKINKSKSRAFCARIIIIVTACFMDITLYNATQNWGRFVLVAISNHRKRGVIVAIFR